MIIPVTEADVTAQCLDFLAYHGVVMHRRNVGGMRRADGRYVRFEESGAADYYGTLPGGRRFEVEFKRTGYKPYGRAKRAHMARQIAWLNDRNEEGAVGLMIDRLEYLQRLWPAVTAGAKFHVHDDGTMEVEL